MSPLERLSLLLPLANRDALTDKELRRAVFSFLHRFEARGLRLQRGEAELWDVNNASASELKATAEKVARVFEVGLLFQGPPPRGTESIDADDIRLPLSFPSIRFGAFSPRTRERGRFALMVSGGRLRDLVGYLAMHLLVTEETRIGRCHAPAPRDWDNECNRVFIWSGMGRPPLVCDPRKCGARVKAKRLAMLAREEREEYRRKHIVRRTKQPSTAGGKK